jgi:hypothetical protein
VAFASIIVMDSESLSSTSHVPAGPGRDGGYFRNYPQAEKAGKTILLVEHKVDMVAQ